MLETLKTLIALLSPASVTLKDLQPKLGAVDKSFTSNTHLKPDDKQFTGINVVQQHKSDQVAHVDFTLTTPIALKDLQAAYGESKIIVPDNGGPKQAIFKIHQPSQPCDIALVATLNKRGDQAEIIILRRDLH
jgi:hypothetical protein